MPTTTQNLIQRLLKSAAVSVLMLGPLSFAAHAAGANAQISGNGFGRSVIKVISENGTSWTKIVKGDMVLPVKIKIGMSGFEVRHYKVRQLAQPEGEYIGIGGRSESVDISTVYNGYTDYLSAAERQDIIGLCNTNLGKGKGIHETHDMLGMVGVQLRAVFLEKGPAVIVGGTDPSGLGEPHLATGDVGMYVKCEGTHGRADDVVAKEPNFRVKGIHLRFMTTAGYPTKPNPATKCQVSQAKVRLETSKAGDVKFRLWTKVGNEPMQNQFVHAMSKFVGPGKFEATFTKTFKVDKTTTVQAMAEDLTNPIGQSTGWKDVQIDCTGAGGGGLAGTPSNSTQDALPQANPKAPFRVIPGVAVGTKVAPIPPRPAPQLPPRFGQIKTAPMPNAVAAKDRFYPSKIRVN